MIRFFFLFLLSVLISHYSQGQNPVLPKTFTLPGEGFMVRGNSSTDPLSKPLKLVTVIDPAETSERELEVWKALMGSMDTDSIGFVFLVRHAAGMADFKKRWFGDLSMNYPYFYDSENKVVDLNGISEDKSKQTFLLEKGNKVVLVGASPMYTDPLNLYRSELHTRTKEMGIEGAVRGVIVEVIEGGIKWFYANEQIYVDENGYRISEKEAKIAVKAGKVIPHTSPLTDTVRLVRRDQVRRPQ